MFHSTSLATNSTSTQQQSRRRRVPALLPRETHLPSVSLPYFTVGALSRSVVRCTLCPSAVHAATLLLPFVGFRHSCCSCSCAVAFALFVMLPLTLFHPSPFSSLFVFCLLFLCGMYLPSTYHGNKHPAPVSQQRFPAFLYVCRWH